MMGHPAARLDTACEYSILFLAPPQMRRDGPDHVSCQHVSAIADIHTVDARYPVLGYTRLAVHLRTGTHMYAPGIPKLAGLMLSAIRRKAKVEARRRKWRGCVARGPAGRYTDRQYLAQECNWHGEGDVTTCEQCGADAIDGRGRCLNCGWQAPGSDYEQDSSPSLGETRAADIQDVVEARNSRATHSPAPRFDRTAQMPPYGQMQPQPAHAGPNTPPFAGATAMTGTSRFCGACGARITGNEAFCGQCGTPIGATGSGFGSDMDQEPTRYQVSGASGWQQRGGDEPTEMFMPAPANPYQPRSGVPYQQTGNAPAVSRADDSSRTVRIVFGILCLAGSISSAVAAIVLALNHH